MIEKLEKLHKTISNLLHATVTIDNGNDCRESKMNEVCEE